MDFVTAARTCLMDKFAEFTGRASRSEFWWFVLFCVVVNMLSGAIFRSWISMLISLALLVPQTAAATRRLHDTGKSGWLQLLYLVPVIGWLLLLYWFVQPGDAQANTYGPPASEPPPAVEMAPGQQ